ncbi:MAG: mechanosensitive ion channel [Burkholderiaceae bacterium]|nr:mechanosensitive ion channel [Burkholderiaceae bacterium]
MQPTALPHSVAPQDLSVWMAHLLQPTVLLELTALLACAALAWWLVRSLRHSLLGDDAQNGVLLGRTGVDGALFPLLWLVLSVGAEWALRAQIPITLLLVALPMLVALVVIRLAVKVVRLVFPNARWARRLERTVSWLVWLVLVLWVTNLLPSILMEMDEITVTLGGSVISVRQVFEGLLTAAFVLIAAMWVASVIDHRLLSNTAGGELSVRKAVSNMIRVVLLFVGLMVALTAVGIDLTALSVLGGAIGVGIGFGLQKLASNYVSGFVILAERSLRIGDMVSVDGFEGAITDIRARFTVIRSLTGQESIVPNEMLLISRVENLSLADTRIWQSTTVGVGYNSDVHLVSDLLLQAARSQERVLADPGPSVSLREFGADGLVFVVGYWIQDPENGRMNVLSAVNFEILRLLREHDIEIPYPQRVVHLKTDAPA